MCCARGGFKNISHQVLSRWLIHACVGCVGEPIVSVKHIDCTQLGTNEVMIKYPSEYTVNYAGSLACAERSATSIHHVQ